MLSPMPNNFETLPRQLIRSTPLIFAVVIVNLGTEAARYVLSAQSFAAQLVVSFVFVFLNIGVGLLGLWSNRPNPWMAYLVASISTVVMVGATTPLSIIARLLVRVPH
jgi:hypothetical protein